ncbi:hypothetical protein KBY96_13970 [Cyanobium sp. ATX 6A2]|uniref:hypothetical protein n=1 Tax=Cyanobium sp. ATX 6A2 TaxID=2823700 RepID=UPI0020CD7955|nr:hypothetical protein [Cyanobium sp. ATX 6A2]MCP9889029.1 hypothetical protein [Cyanobium sp. ATX 6A2]
MALNFEGRPPGGLRADALSARAKVEALYYSLLNPYLSDRQKAVLEVWFQLPVVVFTYGYLAFSIVSDALPVKPVFCAIYLSLIAGWLMTAAANEATLEPLVPVLAVANNAIVSFGLIILVALTGNITWYSAAGLGVISMTGLPNAGMQLAGTWATNKYPRLNPKYGAAKEIFRREGSPLEFAFERYLDSSGEDAGMDEASAKGKAILCWIYLALLTAATVLWG